MAKEVNINLKTVGGQDLIGTGDIELQKLQSSDSIKIVNGQAQRKALTGDVTVPENGNTTTIADSAVKTPTIADDNVTLQKLQKIASNVILGNNGGTADNPKELTTAEVIAMLGLGNVFTPKGSVASYSSLLLVGNTIGDVYNVLDGQGIINDGENVVWNGSGWDNFGGTVDLSNYYTKSQIDEIKLTDLSDSGISSPQKGQIIVYNQNQIYSCPSFVLVDDKRKAFSGKIINSSFFGKIYDIGDWSNPSFSLSMFDISHFKINLRANLVMNITTNTQTNNEGNVWRFTMEVSGNFTFSFGNLTLIGGGSYNGTRMNLIQCTVVNWGTGNLGYYSIEN